MLSAPSRPLCSANFLPEMLIVRFCSTMQHFNRKSTRLAEYREKFGEIFLLTLCIFKNSFQLSFHALSKFTIQPNL